MQDLVAAQAAIEEEALNMGITRYREERAKDETNTRPGKRLLIESLRPLSGAISEWVADATSGKPTPHANLGYFLMDIDPMVAAYVTSKRVIHGMVAQASLQSVALGVSASLEDAVNFEKLKQESPRGYAQLQRKIAHTPNVRYRHVVMRKQQKYAGVRTVKWGNKERLTIGLLLIDLMRESVIVNGQPLFTRELGNKQGGRALHALYNLVPTPAAAEWLEESHARCELLEPVHLPMVVQPRPWSNPRDGGYLHPKLQYPLVKTKGRWAYLEELQHFPMPKVYTAVNALQDTPWRVNKAVLGVMREAWEQNAQIAKLPPRDPLPVPPNAPEDASDTEVQARRAEKASVHTQNARLMSKRLALGAKLWMGEKFSAFTRVYFPHALDWRGRAYPVASYMHPQADDTGKALLEFADGVALGDNGAYWLAVHGANCYGVDKLSFDERAQWVIEHTDEIVASALDPLSHRGSFWTKTEEAPWRFLAFCFEWAGYITSGQSPAYVSHIPVAFDGSCNGLQNYSMMLRDEVGGAATNLVPSEKPSDIYTQVALALEKIVARDAPTRPEAAMWVGKVVRKVAKPPTMTMPYGAGQFGYRQQIIDALRKIEADTGKRHLDGPVDDFTAAGYLAGIMREALAGVVVKAAQAMDWLQEASRIASEDGLPIRWESPAGLPVVQDYRVKLGERIDAVISGARIQLMLSVEGEDLDKRRQAQGIAPNFVHSLDAAHMMETVCLGLGHGINAFAMVHDSYAAHAGHADTLNVLLRESFVAMYREDVLGKFRDALVKQLPPKLASRIPALPLLGTLEPEAVLASEYFFA